MSLLHIIRRELALRLAVNTVSFFISVKRCFLFMYDDAYTKDCCCCIYPLLFNYSISLLIICSLRRNGLARTGVSIVVIKQILTATEYNVISSIPTENARAVMANPTVPLPF